jgi:hypothetical protein
MAAHKAFDTIVERNQFLQQVALHHRRGDHYPDPQVISRELHFTSAQIDTVLSSLRTLRWIADSPYGSDRLRLTPRCWSALRRVSILPDGVSGGIGEETRSEHWLSVEEESGLIVTSHPETLVALAP